MVVRERRRVANLVRTACNLDVKSIENEKLLESKDAAFKSYVEEEKAEKAKLTRQHQEDIWSLMSLVEGNEGRGIYTSTEGKHILPNNLLLLKRRTNPQRNLFNSVDILARGGLQALESEVISLRQDREENMFFKKEAENLKRVYEQKELQCKELNRKVELLSNRTSIPTSEHKYANPVIHDSSDQLPGHVHHAEVQGDVTSSKQSPGDREDPSNENRKLHSRFSIIGMIESSDDEDAEEPEWADDIMADLAMIAEGEMPPSLLSTRNVPESPGSRSFSSSGSESRRTNQRSRRLLPSQISVNSVFDRLANPHNFTGVQKQRINSCPSPALNSKEHKISRVKRKEKKSPDPTRFRSRKSHGSPASSDGSKSPGSSSPRSPRSSPISQTLKNYVSSSVYERLQNPVNFTGIQKAKFDLYRRKSKDSMK